MNGCLMRISDAQIDDSLATIDTAERYAKYIAIQKEIVDLSPSLFVYDQVEKHAYQDYLDWPAASGGTSGIMGYYMYGPQIAINK